MGYKNYASQESCQDGDRVTEDARQAGHGSDPTRVTDDTGQLGRVSDETQDAFAMLVPARDFKLGTRYAGTPVGEFQRDADGRYWWRRVDGSIMEVFPHPSALFMPLKAGGSVADPYHGELDTRGDA
jgi:hypothetical protein